MTKKIDEYKKQETSLSNNEPVPFDSLPYEKRKAIIEELEKENDYYSKLISQSKNENN